MNWYAKADHEAEAVGSGFWTFVGGVAGIGWSKGT